MCRQLLYSCLCLFTFLSAKSQILQADTFKHYVDGFDTMADDSIVQAIPDSASWDWLKTNVPLFESPDTSFNEIYYFRWWTLRKHIKLTEQGYVFTEFLINRSYADKYNLISSALGHHIYEGRWIHDAKYLNDYIHIWYRGNSGKPMKKLRFYSGWNEDALYNRYLVNGDADFLKDLYPDLVADYTGWEEERKSKEKLFWQYDVRDAMEETISGSRREKNLRPSINGYMYGNAVALSKMALLNNHPNDAKLYANKANTIKQGVQQKLWNTGSHFFEVKKEKGDTLSNTMEEIGFIPWYFNLPDKEYSAAWDKLMDSKHFNAPKGITTADISDPAFRSHGCCKCEWDGAVWPFATSQTLTAMANLLNNYKQQEVSKEDYFVQLTKYAQSQHKNGKPYIGEYMDQNTGTWLTPDERGRYYNHSTFNDLVITGLVGLRPRQDNIIDVNPLVPAGKWDWFALDNVLYHGRTLAIVWDKTGHKYGKGKGLSVWVDGKKIAYAGTLTHLKGKF
ncbi:MULTISPECIES: MGH1-like glycoside hydrolase domain-containing protein [Chitinophagaceae]